MKKWMIIVLCCTFLAGCTSGVEPKAEDARGSIKDSVVEDPTGESVKDSMIDRDALIEVVLSDLSYVDLHNTKEDGTYIDICFNNYSITNTPNVFYRVNDATILDHIEITPEDYALIFEKTDAYKPTIEKNRQDYWPHTSEYPEMLVLFSVEAYRTGENYEYDGALCKPDGYDEFFEDIENILEKYVNED